MKQLVSFDVRVSLQDDTMVRDSVKFLVDVMVKAEEERRLKGNEGGEGDEDSIHLDDDQDRRADLAKCYC